MPGKWGGARRARPPLDPPMNSDGNTALIHATKIGHVSCVKELVKAGAELNVTNSDGNTALIHATKIGHVDCVKELVKARAELNVTNSDGNTALILAAYNGHTDCVKELVKAEVELNVTNSDGNTALILAAYNGHVDCVKELVKAGAKLNVTNGDGNTALIFAADNGHVDCVKELVKARAEFNATRSKGNTALISVIKKGHIDCVKELIDVGADVNVCSDEIPLLCAIRREDIKYVKDLLTTGGDVKTKCGVDGALIVACKSDNEANVTLLLKCGADVNFEDADGRTALYVTVTRSHAAYKREKSNKESKDLPNAVHFRNSPYTNMVFLFLKAGAHLNETSSGLDPSTVHLQPPYSIAPNIHIIKMLSVAGANLGDNDMNLEEDSSLKVLQGSASEDT